MKICAVTSWFPTAVNPGAGSFVATDVKALASAHDMRIVHFVDPHLDDGERTIDLDGIPGIRVPLDLKRPWTWAAALRTAWPYLKNAEVVHTMAFSSLLKILPTPFRAPVVHTEHWTGMMRIRASRFAALKIPAVRVIMARPKVATGVSSYLADEIASLSGREVRVVPNIVNAPAFQPPRPFSGRLNILSVGYLSPIKDPLIAVGALAELRSRGIDAHLTWAGSGTMESEVRAAAQRAGISDALHLLGHVGREELYAKLAACHVVLHTSTEETFSLVAAEALATGRPLAIQERGGHRDFARAPYATLVADRSATAFADAIEAAAQAGQSIDFSPISSEIHSRFSAAAFVSRWSAIYEEVTR